MSLQSLLLLILNFQVCYCSHGSHSSPHFKSYKYYIVFCCLNQLQNSHIEWDVESMHWLLYVRFEEDWCKIKDSTILKNLNIPHKFYLNVIKLFKSHTRAHICITTNVLRLIQGVDNNAINYS